LRFLARIYLMPKPSILDPQGKAVEGSLHSLGFREVADARIGKLIELHVDGDSAGAVRTRVDEMCRRLLANEIIEDFRFDVEEQRS